MTTVNKGGLDIEKTVYDTEDIKIEYDKIDPELEKGRINKGGLRYGI